MSEPLTNAEKRDLKARAQRLEPVLKVGHAGVTPAFLASMEEALKTHELVKIRFTAHKDQKKALAPQIAEKTASTLVARVGHVAVYHRRPGGEVAATPRRAE